MKYNVYFLMALDKKGQIYIYIYYCSRAALILNPALFIAISIGRLPKYVANKLIFQQKYDCPSKYFLTFYPSV